jgi:hypothetical protein
VGVFLGGWVGKARAVDWKKRKPETFKDSGFLKRNPMLENEERY